MNGQVDNTKTMLKEQGKRVRVTKTDGTGAWILTIINRVDGDHHELRLVNKELKTRKPDWPLSQALWNAVEPVENNPEFEYQLTIK